MRRFLFWSLCFCLLFPVGLSSCDGSDSAAVIFGGTTGELTWTLTEDGVLTITGEGPMPDYRDGGTSETPPWYPHVNRISSLTIGEGVTRIGDYAFMLCSFVTEVVIPESVTSMGDWAFWECSSLEMITFEKGSKLESISGVRDLGAFDGAINLTTVDMSECTQVKRIDEYTFYGNSNLRLFKIGTEIPPTCKDYTFYNINPYSVLKVPSGCTDAYKKATGWKKFASITGLDE